MAKYNEFLTQSDATFDANHQNRNSNIADTNDSFKILLKQNIIRSYGGNDEVVVENINLTQNTSRYYTVVGCNQIKILNHFQERLSHGNRRIS